MSRKYDIIVFGATGITGGYTADYLAQNAPKDLKWAIAGRSLRKLEDVRNTLVNINPSLASLDLLIADSSDISSLDAITSQTKVIITTVGPFLKYGLSLVESCVRNGTHYVDSTGEAPFVKTLIDKYHDQARANGIILVPCSGFDCVPSDLGVYYLTSRMRKKYFCDTASIKFSLIKIKGKASGGTLASMMEIMSSTEDKSSLFNPYFLSPAPAPAVVTPPSIAPKFDPHFNNWQGYYFMSSINETIVHRSEGLFQQQGKGYGPNFNYKETMSMPFIASIFMAVSFAFFPIFSFLISIPAIKSLIQKILPPPGSGPKREELEKGYYEIKMVAEAEAGIGSTQPHHEPLRLMARIKAFGDPGYWETCKMLVESALSIVYDLHTIPATTQFGGGVLTPSTAFGDVLLDRLRRTGQIWEIYEL